MCGKNRRMGTLQLAGGADEFTDPDGGKTAHYMVRWLSARSEAGPWSETASATVGIWHRRLPMYGATEESR